MSAYPESHHDLLAHAGVGALSTIGADGRPQVTALWYLFDDGEIRLSLNEARQKTKNLLANPQVTLLLVDFANPYRTIEVRADATWEWDEDYAFADKVGAQYGADLRNMDQPGERRVVVTLHPVKVNTSG
jgi:PPOX class probable F420-dependent enzyme